MKNLSFRLHHDLGKVGDWNGEYYIPQDNDWRRKTLGEVFTHNTEIDNMRVTDSFSYLYFNTFGVKVSLKETLLSRYLMDCMMTLTPTI